MPLVCFKIVSGQYFLFVEGIQIPVRILAAALLIGLGIIPLCSYVRTFSSSTFKLKNPQVYEYLRVFIVIKIVE
ncbi:MULTISPECIES: hypothetical protein [Bacillus]|uniref:hypothetical protein n=1 Tax=Bacillus TaxID=1386 RepID=UPI0001A01AB6|nr:hypothetical protein [Bacillus tropicus]AJH71922.1 hypothetical protein BF35_1775 [Bacillus cereus ATCC 4342]EEK85688.1 hypothetical protein bcere0010_7770 [Bacillus cereus ATCC 4342]KFM88915.1 hypothetical protein DJ86_3975 [Bacillus cereus ATCC 4342]MDR4453842.1 hypothetical protein [Bacillus tropicus]MEC2922121.1 hypothetical protein [Bacillus tropicus]